MDVGPWVQERSRRQSPGAGAGLARGLAALALGAVLLAGPAAAQPMGPASAGMIEAPPLDHRPWRAQDLAGRYPREIEIDERGEAVVRGEVLGLGVAPGVLDRARKAGFRIRRVDQFPELELELTVFAAPRGMAVDEAVRRLRALDPGGDYDVNPIYLESALVLADQTPAGAAAPRARPAAAPTRIGMIDGGVDARHRSLARSRIEQRAFAPGGLTVTPHGTAVASLLAGLQAPFRGAAPGASLCVADAYGAGGTGGSAAILVRALAWLTRCGAPVINISLVGPANHVLARAVGVLVRRGYVLVAPVGNDGPAGRAYFPASYPGVVAVAPVDARKRRLPEASRADHVDFAAPGADMVAAAPGGGFMPVRGSSFASPLVAGGLAQFMQAPDPAARARAIDALARGAEDLGAPGVDPLFGRGLVAFDLRTEPVQMDAAGSPRRIAR